VFVRNVAANDLPRHVSLLPAVALRVRDDTRELLSIVNHLQSIVYLDDQFDGLFNVSLSTTKSTPDLCGRVTHRHH
jgi:hypothetical protein